MKINLFFIFCIAIFHGYELSICAIFRNEAPYIKEWIEFHKIQGVEHFYLYNNNSTDHCLEVLQPYIDSGSLTLIDWPFTYERGISLEWFEIQNSSYMDCIQRFGAESDWIAVIDLDEYLYSPQGIDLRKFLKPYRKFGALCVNWMMFGTSWVEEIPTGETLIEHLIWCAPPNEERHFRGKSIVQPKYVTGCLDAHNFLFQDNFFAVDVYGKKLLSATAFPRISHNWIRINHYWTRTEKWFRENKIPSRNERRSHETADVLRKRADLYNKCMDRAILRFVPLLRERMGF